MRSLGYDVGRHLYVAFVLSGIIASIAGVLYVYYNRFINPVAASFPVSVEAVLMAIVGGSGTILGPFLGSGIILVLRNWVSGFFHYYTAVLGIVFIVTVLWAPQGIMGLVARWRAGNRRDGAGASPRSASSGSRKYSGACAPSTMPRSSSRAASAAC